jgi:hypothetical protein
LMSVCHDRSTLLLTIKCCLYEHMNKS